MGTDEQPRPSEKADDDADCEHCYLCAVANAKKKGSKCWWHMPTSMDWPIADNSYMGNTSNGRHCPSSCMNEMPEWFWATREKFDAEENKEGNEQSELRQNKSAVPQPIQNLLLSTFMPLVRDQKLCIQCRQSNHGRKTIEIFMKIPTFTTILHANIFKIWVPQAAYQFLEAMDRLIGQLPVEAPANSPPVLATQMAEGGISNNFQFSVLWSERQWNVNIRSVKKVQGHKEKAMHFPLWALPWLRQQMAAMLANVDGSERICKMPTIPEWAMRASPKIEQLEKQPNVEQEQLTDNGKKADDADEEDCPCCTKEEKCWWHMPKSSGLANRGPFRHGKR